MTRIPLRALRQLKCNNISEGQPSFIQLASTLNNHYRRYQKCCQEYLAIPLKKLDTTRHTLQLPITEFKGLIFLVLQPSILADIKPATLAKPRARL